MKKIYLSALALMIGAIGFAQVNNDAQINQVGPSNDGTVFQDGNTNVATVDQFGTNFADVYQDGDDNDADVDQGTSPDHKTNVPLTGYYGAGSYVRQIGDDNDAIVTVTGNSVGSRIDQDGNDNYGTQLLAASSSYRGKSVNGNDGRMSIEIIQNGNDNVGYQKTTPSFGSHGIQQMWVDQEGMSNYGSQHSKGGAQSVMTIKQVGDNNGNAVDADVTSTGLNSPLALGFEAGNEAYTQYQNGRFSTATIDILGSDNKTTQAQEYTVWSTSGANNATIDITGHRNAVIQGQLGESNESYVEIVGDDNVVTTSQEGDLNKADVDVDGNLNIGGVMQTGNAHEGIISQYGDNNFGTITSAGNNHYGEIMQTGNMNKALITQQN